MTRPAPSALVLLGAPVAHSLSPRFQNAALAAAGLDVRYEARHVEAAALPRLLRELVAAGAAGNVTVPHKEAVARLCDARTPLAERVGAVNTFWSDGGRLVGDNTDVGGFLHLLRRTLGGPPRAGTRVVLLGAGGAAAAVLAACEAVGVVDVRVHARTVDRAAALVARFPRAQVADGDVRRAMCEADVVVNATPLGLRDGELPVDPALLPPGATVVDLVYRPGETDWVRAARARGHPAADGLGMLVEQGALAFERWFGRPPDRAVMWRALGVDPTAGS